MDSRRADIDAFPVSFFLWQAFCLLAHIAATLSALPTILLINSLPAGSFALIGAIATQYELATPTIYRLRVFGVPLSSKFVVYLNLLLLVWHQPKSMISLMTGGCFTLIFYPRLQHLRVPIPIIANLSSSTVAAPRRQDRTLPLEFGEMPGAREARQIAQFRRARANAAAGGEPTSIVENITGGGGVTRARQVTTRTDDDNGGSGSRDDDDENTALPQALGAPGAAETRATTRTTSSRLSRLVGQVAGRAGDVYAVGGGGSLRTSEREITTIAAMFPNLPRARIVEALQRHDWNSARAVESLLES